MSVAGTPFGDIPAGKTSEYRTVASSLRYASLELKAQGLSLPPESR